MHEYYPTKPKEQIEHKKVYNEIIKTRNNSFDNLLDQLNNDKIGKEEFIFEYNEVKNIAQEKANKYKEKKALIAKKYSVIGYTSYKNFLLGVSLPSFGFFCTLLFLYVIIKEVADKRKKLYYLSISLAFILAWGYWLSWSVLNHTQDPNRPFDFPRSYYNFSLYILPLIFFVIFYLIFRYFKTIEEKATLIIGLFYKAFYKDLPQKNLVNPKKSDEFRRFRTELTQKAVDNE